MLLAHDGETGADVKIQLVEIPGEPGDEGPASVLRACGALVGVEHPNLVSVVDVDEQEGVPYVVTEHVEGTPFEVFCRPDSLLPGATVCELLAAAARGLQEAHRIGVVHGDIRPGVLLRIDEATAKVTDFGLVSCMPPGDGGVRGTPGYLSPEQIRGEAPDARSDVFALGAVTYEMLTGQKAFPGDSVSAVLYRTVNEPLQWPESDPPVPADVIAVVNRALAKQSEERYEGAGAFAEELEQASLVLSVEQRLHFAFPLATEPAEKPTRNEEAPRHTEAKPPAPDEPPARPPGGGGASTAASPAEAAPSPPPVRRGPRRSSARPFVLGTVLVAVAASVAWMWMRERRQEAPPPAATLEAHVRTEPSGLEVRLDGEPLDEAAGGVVRYEAGGPFGLLTASLECRTAEHRLGATDAGKEVVLVLDPVDVDVRVDTEVAGAQVRVNGERVATAPTQLELDLCRDNRVELAAAGYHPAAVDIPAGADPLDARKQVYSLALEPIPRGRLTLAQPRNVKVIYSVDGKRIGEVGDLELEEGDHELRIRNDYHWIDSTRTVTISAGETTTPEVVPRLGTLAVQAFPSNCKVFLRRPGGQWRFLDETPAERRVAVGRYEVKIELKPTGESRITAVDLEEGKNPPVRVAFGGTS